MAADEGRTSSEEWLPPAPRPKSEPASLEPPKPPFPDVPGVTITAEIGAGGMGRVYRARQSFVDRDAMNVLLDLLERAGTLDALRERYEAY